MDWIFFLVILFLWMTLLGWLRSRFGWKGSLAFFVLIGLLKVIAS